MRTCGIPTVIAAFIHNYVSVQVRKELLQRSLLHTVTGVYEASLDVDRSDLCSGTYVQAPLTCLQENQAFNLQHKTLPPANACARSQQPPKPQSSPTPKCRCTHSHTDIYAHNHPLHARCQLSTAAPLPLTALTTTRPPKM